MNRYLLSFLGLPLPFQVLPQTLYSFLLLLHLLLYALKQMILFFLNLLVLDLTLLLLLKYIVL